MFLGNYYYKIGKDGIDLIKNGNVQIKCHGNGYKDVISSIQVEKK